MSQSKSSFHYIIIVIILLGGAWVRFDSLTTNERFHVDEAWFSTFSRNATVYGDWMLSGALDKPPVSIYASALSMHFTASHVDELGVIDVPLIQGEFASKLPNTLSGVVLIALVYTLTIHLYHDRVTALVAMLFSAISPYMIAYSASAFTDQLMLVFMVASLVALSRNRLFWVGILLGLSFASKQQALAYLPLLAGMWWLLPHRRLSQIKNFALGFGVILALLMLWDQARPETSIFTLMSVNGQPKLDNLFPTLGDLPDKLGIWWGYWGAMFGHWLTTGLVIVAGAIYAVFNFNPTPALLTRRQGVNYQVYRYHALLLAYCLLFMLVYGVLNFNTFNRYLLPIIPLLGITGAKGIVWMWRKQTPPLNPLPASREGTFAPVESGQLVSIQQSTSKRYNANISNMLRYLAILIFTLIIVINLSTHLDIGRDVDNPDGIMALAEFINDKPLGTIVYDHWLGWEMGYYLGAWTDKRSVYYPDAQIFGEDAPLNPDRAPRYFIAESIQPINAWLDTIQSTDFTVSLVYENAGYVAYELIPPPYASESGDSD